MARVAVETGIPHRLAGSQQPGVKETSRAARLVRDAEELVEQAEQVAAAAERVRDYVLGSAPKGEGASPIPPSPGLLGAFDINLTRIRSAVLTAARALAELHEGIAP